MGAFLLMLAINTFMRARLGYDKRASLIAFVVAIAISIPLASFGFSGNGVSPLQQLPYVALAYGKFALAFLVIDLYNARKLAEDPKYIKTRGRFGFQPNPSWAAGLVIVAAGAALSYVLLSAQGYPSPFATSTASSVSSSPRPNSDSMDWRTITSEDSLFSVRFPGQPTHSESTMQNPKTGRPIKTHSWEITSTSGMYNLSAAYMKPEDIAPSATAQRILLGSFNGVLSAWKSEGMTYQITQQESTNHGAWPAIDATAIVASGADTLPARFRIILAGRQLYTLMVIQSTETDAKTFFESFSVRAPDAYRIP